MSTYPVPAEGAIFPYPSDPWIPGLLKPAVAIPTAVAAAGAGIIGWTQGGHGALLDAAAGIVCAVLVVLAVIDLQTHRLPDVIVLPLYLVIGLPLLYAAAAGTISWSTAGAAGISMVILLAIFGAVHRFTGGLGLGDVKLSGALGLILGMHGGYEVFLGGYVLPCLFGGVAAFALMFSKQAKTELAFGPYIAAGALAILLMPGVIAPFVAAAAGSAG